MSQKTKDRLISIFLLLGIVLLPLLLFFLVLPWVVELNTAGVVISGTRGFIAMSGILAQTLILLAFVVGIITAMKIPQHHKKSSNTANFLALVMFSVCLMIAITSFLTLTLQYPVGTNTIPVGVNLGVGAILTGVLAIIIALLYLFVFIIAHIKGQSELELRIDNLKTLLDKHYITNEQFEEGKAKLLAELA